MSKRDATGRFAKGSSGNPRGRPTGAEAQITREVRELVRQALDDEGGTGYLRWAAREHPVAFLSLVGRLVPAEIRGALEIVPVVSIRDYTGVEHERPFQREGVEVEDVGTGLPAALLERTQPAETGHAQSPGSEEPETLTVIPLTGEEGQEPIYGVAKRPPERF